MHTAAARGARRWLSALALTCAWAVVPGPIVSAGPVKIGALNEGWGPTPATVGLRDGLAALGYREGEQFVIGVRFTQGDRPALVTGARDLLHAGSDIIFASGTHAAKAAHAATTSVPVVFAEAVSDPVAVGLVKSIRRPGGNVTGITDDWDELTPKRLEIFKEMLPGLKRVLFVYDPNSVDVANVLLRTREAARRLGLALVDRPVGSVDDVRATLATVRKGADGIVTGGPMTFNIPGFVLDATSGHGIPSMFNAGFFADRGGLAGYGPDLYESGRQAARLVDKIIKGQAPATIPVEANPRIELVINLKVAKALGITVAPSALQRATRIVE